MEVILQEVEKAVAAKLYYLAIAMALTVPDVCAALKSSDGETNRPKFIEWYSENLGKKYPDMRAIDCYYLRCAVLHQGRIDNPYMHLKRIVFSLPDETGNVAHHNYDPKELILNLDAV